MLLVGLLLAGASLSGCASSAPKPPALNLYIHDASHGVAYGSSSDGQALKPVSMKDTDNWYLLPPQEWQKVQDYVDLLTCVLDGGCKGGPPTSMVSITAQDLKQVSKKLKQFRHRIEFQRINNGNSDL